MTDPQYTPTHAKTLEVYRRSILEDDDLGYPNSVEFIPADQAWTDAAIWAALHVSRQAVVVVTEEQETLLLPRRRNPLLHWADGVLGSTPVRRSSRPHGGTTYAKGTRARVRRRVREDATAVPLPA